MSPPKNELISMLIKIIWKAMTFVLLFHLNNAQLPQYDEITTETFDGNNHTLGWIKVISCIETTKVFTDHQSNIQNLATQANSIKIVPEGSINNAQYDQYAVIAKPNSQPVIALNNYKEVGFSFVTLGFTITGQANKNDWIGSDNAKSKLESQDMNQLFGDELYSFSKSIFHAFHNEDGLHVVPVSSDGKWCTFGGTTNVGQNIEIFFGYLLTSSPTAIPTMDPTFGPTIMPTFDPTAEPTSEPTIYPTVDPTVYPTIYPTVYPTIYPTVYPTIYPTVYPTIYPTVYPTMYSTVYPTTYPSMDPTIFPTRMSTLYSSAVPTVLIPTVRSATIPSFSLTASSTDQQSTSLNTKLTENDRSPAENSNFVSLLIVILSGIVVILCLVVFLYRVRMKKERRNRQENIKWEVEMKETNFTQCKQETGLESNEHTNGVNTSTIVNDQKFMIEENVNAFSNQNKTNSIDSIDIMTSTAGNDNNVVENMFLEKRKVTEGNEQNPNLIDDEFVVEDEVDEYATKVRNDHETPQYNAQLMCCNSEGL